MFCTCLHLKNKMIEDLIPSQPFSSFFAISLYVSIEMAQCPWGPMIYFNVDRYIQGIG